MFIINIEIKSGVKKYLNEKNLKDIYIEMDNRGGCCSGPVFVPTVKLGKPEGSDLYDIFEVDGITVYFPKKMDNEETNNITIKLRNILGHKSLVVNGILAYKENAWKKKKY
jgi:hypothetical protein